jgi:hypothetical protein
VSRGLCRRKSTSYLGLFMEATAPACLRKPEYSSAQLYWALTVCIASVASLFANLILISGGKMEYKKMLCWVRPHEKKELKEAVKGRFPLVIAKNYNDFISKITDDAYLIISLSKTKFSFKKIQSLQNNFSNKIHFYMLKDDEYFTVIHYNIMDEKNSIPGQYSAKELVNNFLGIIPDLWEMRRNEK